MRHAVQLIAVIACAIVAGCASVIDVDSADPRSIAQASSWAFLDPTPAVASPRARAAFTDRVTSPLRDARVLDADVARQIERLLEARGFERVAADADFYVHYQLTLQPRSEMVEVPFPSRYVASLSYSPSYIVEGLEVVKRRFEDLRLAVSLRERGGRILWRGELTRTLAARDALELEARVAQLLRRVPRRGDR